jgi:hypothetical protein
MMQIVAFGIAEHAPAMADVDIVGGVAPDEIARARATS